MLASGSGSNFEALVTALRSAGHEVALLLCDQAQAGCLDRARRLSVPYEVVTYDKSRGAAGRLEAEAALTRALEACGARLVVLAGFMRILGPGFVARWRGRLLNIHPSLLPRHPGAHGLTDSFASDDPELGITVHWVDEGVDTGAIVEQARFTRPARLSLEDAERRLHALEHEVYPRVVLRLLER